MEDFDDTRMQDLGEKYPEYDDMNITDLLQRYNELTDEQTTIESEQGDQTRLDEINEEKNYLERLQKLKQEDTEVHDEQTVTIVRKTQRSNSAPEVPSIQPRRPKPRVNLNVRPINVAKVAVEDFIGRNYNIENFRFDDSSDDAIELRNNIKRTDKNNISYRPLTRLNERNINYRNVLTRDSNGVLQYNDASRNEEAVRQFKQVIEKIVDRERTKRDMPMIGTSIQIDDIPGLTPDEMREYRGVMSPSETMVPEARQKALIIQAKEYQKEIDKTKNRMDEIDSSSNVDDAGEYIELQERLNGLVKARDDTLDQKQREEARHQQEEDITRLQKFKKWAKENMVGLTALSVSVAGLITTLIVGARKAIVAGAQATSRFGKAIADLGKKLWPLLGPILGLIGTAISWGAAGLAWLASNLWVLAVAFAWLIYDQYKQRKKRNKT